MKIFNIPILFIFIILIFYLSNKFVFKKNVKEHYLTYFLQFYNDKVDDLANFYNNNENNLNYFKKKFNYQILKLGIINQDKYFANIIINEYISKSNLYKAVIKKFNDRLHGLSEIINNEIDLNINNYATIIYYSDTLKGNINDLRLITSLYKLYIYIFAKKTSKIYNLNKIPFGIIIGIFEYPSVFFLYHKKFFNDLGYKENIDYIPKYYKNHEDLFNGFFNNECELIIFADVFPSITVMKILNNVLSPDIILIPFDYVREELFLHQNPHINIDYVDLNLFNKNYLPKKFGDYEYTKNKPIFKMCYLHKILLTHKNTDPNITYSIIKFFFENWKYINSTLADKSYEISKIQIDNVKINYLDYHTGVIKYFYEKGLITNTNNDNCSNLYGVMECNKKNLENNGFITSQN